MGKVGKAGLILGGVAGIGMLAWASSSQAEPAPLPQRTVAPPPPPPPPEQGGPRLRAPSLKPEWGAPYVQPVQPQRGAPSVARPVTPPQGGPPSSGTQGGPGVPGGGGLPAKGPPPSGEVSVPYGGVRQAAPLPEPAGTEVPFGGARSPAAPTVTVLPAVPLPPAGTQSLDPAGRLPLYQLGTPFTVTLPTVDPDAWKGKSGPPYVTRGTVVEVRWSPAESIPVRALDAERKTGTYSYTVWLAEFKAPKNTWTGSEGMLSEVIASGVFKLSGKKATVGAAMTLDQALDALDAFLRANDLRFYLTASKGRVFGLAAALMVPRGARQVVRVNGRPREMSEDQLFALGKLVAEKFTNHYGFPVDVEWMEA